jgi:hypothetical protein
MRAWTRRAKLKQPTKELSDVIDEVRWLEDVSTYWPLHDRKTYETIVMIKAIRAMKTWTRESTSILGRFQGMS